jgi:hypothetical protein
MVAVLACAQEVELARESDSFPLEIHENTKAAHRLLERQQSQL